MALLSSLGVVYARLLPGADAAIDFGQQPRVDHPEEHQASLLIQYLLVGRMLLLFMKSLRLQTSIHY